MYNVYKLLCTASSASFHVNFVKLLFPVNHASCATSCASRGWASVTTEWRENGEDCETSRCSDPSWWFFVTCTSSVVSGTGSAAKTSMSPYVQLAVQLCCLCCWLIVALHPFMNSIVALSRQIRQARVIWSTDSETLSRIYQYAEWVLLNSNKNHPSYVIPSSDYRRSFDKICRGRVENRMCVGSCIYVE